MNLQPLLDYINIIVPLTKEEEGLVHAKFKTRKYRKGQFVLQNGDVCLYENFVLSGCLKTFLVDEQGQEHIVMFAIENWWTGDLSSFLSQTLSGYNIQCLEHSELAQITSADLEDLYQQVPKMERFFRIIIQKAFVASVKRTLQNFTMSAKERYLWFRRQYPQIEQRVPQYLIASYLGFTPEFLSKIRSQVIQEQ